MKKAWVIGLGLGPQDITPYMAGLIARAQVLAGGKRLLDWIPDHRGTRLELSGGLDSWLDAIAQAAREKTVAVLASGDPGFFGVAKNVIERLGPDHVEVVPNLSAMQAGCARLKKSWDEAAHVSLHVTTETAQARLWRAMNESGLVSVYTGPDLGPAQIAALLMERGQDNWRMHVLEDLGAADERTGSYEPAQAAGLDFSALNLVLLQRRGPARRPRLGLAEAEYAHERGVITKAEVRTAALGKLSLEPGLTLWDLGAGCGSLSLEASLLMPGGRIVALEKDPNRVEMIKANRAKFGVGMLEIVPGRAPEALQELPSPHRVFIGGGGADLGSIISASAKRLLRGGMILVSAVQLESVAAARQALRQSGLAVDETLLQISRGSPLGSNRMLKAFNPVWLIRGKDAAERQSQ